MRRSASAASGTPGSGDRGTRRAGGSRAIGTRSRWRRAIAHGAKDGDNVIVEITKRPQGESPAHGRIVEVLEDLRPSDLAARFAILRHDLPQEFPPEVLHAANRFRSGRAGRRTAQGREDLRDLPLVTIDGEDAKDFDDAVYAERAARRRLAAGRRHRRCQPLRALSAARSMPKRARAPRRCTFRIACIPMLPEHLSNHLCSLMPQVERLAFVCDMRVSKTGKPGKSRFYEAVIRSHARLTYDQAWRLPARIRRARRPTALTPAVRASLQTLYAVYGALKAARDARGALDFRGGEVKARIGDDGKIEGFYAVTRNDAHRLIEECMIAANVRGGGGAASRQGEEPVSRARPAGGQARHRAAEGDERPAGRRDVLREADAARVSPAGRAAGRAARRCCCSRAW